VPTPATGSSFGPSLLVRAQYGRDIPAEPHAGRDDHPARLFPRFLTDRGDKRAMEVIWGNRLKAVDYKYISGFPRFVADGGDDRVGRWLDEKIDLERIYARFWKDAAPAHLVDVAVFCDSDDTTPPASATSLCPT
jgi:hypothetical protein